MLKQLKRSVVEASDRVRVGVHDALAATTDSVPWTPFKVARDLVGTLNDVTGRFFCSKEELEARRARGASAASTRRSGGGVSGVVKREAAPVMLYFDGKDHRTKKKMEEVLRARDIPFQVLDCTDDEATRSWAQTAAHTVEFPILFIAGEPVGGLHELTQLDVSGKLLRRVFG